MFKNMCLVALLMVSLAVPVQANNSQPPQVGDPVGGPSIAEAEQSGASGDVWLVRSGSLALAGLGVTGLLMMRVKHRK